MNLKVGVALIAALAIGWAVVAAPRLAQAKPEFAA